MILRCTNKLLKELGLVRSKLTGPSGGAAPDNDWYANLFYLNRRKCVMFTHAGSLFSFVAHDVRRKDIKNINELFRKELSRALYHENFSGEEIKGFIERLGDIECAPTASRSILGSMNDLIYQYSVMTSYETDPADMVVRLNETPMQPFQLGRPIERFKRYCLNTASSIPQSVNRCC